MPGLMVDQEKGKIAKQKELGGAPRSATVADLRLAGQSNDLIPSGAETRSIPTSLHTTNAPGSGGMTDGDGDGSEGADFFGSLGTERKRKGEKKEDERPDPNKVSRIAFRDDFASSD